MENIEVLVIGILTVICGSFSVILILFYTKRHEVIDEFTRLSLENTLKMIMEDENLQKQIYQVGGLVGQGFKTGSGLSMPKSGKFRFEDLITGLAAQFFQGGQSSPPPATPTTSPQLDKSKRW